MSKWRVALAALTAMVVTLPAAAQQGAPIPEQMGSLWVSGRSAEETEYFAHLRQRHADRLAESSRAGECLAANSWFPPDGPARDPASLEETTLASAILLGRVTGTAPGLYSEVHAGQMVRVEVIRWIKEPSGIIWDFDSAIPRALPPAHRAEAVSGRGETAYFFYGGGPVQLAPGLEYCGRDGWPAAPEIGSRVIVFAYTGLSYSLQLGAGILRTAAEAKDVVIETAAGMRTSPGLQEIAEFRILDFDEFRRHLVDAIQRGVQ